MQRGVDRWFLLCFLMLAWAIVYPSPKIFALQQEQAAHLIKIQLPLSGSDDERIIRQLEEILDRPAVGNRPTVILEFTRHSEAARSLKLDEVPVVGAGTSFSRALGLARWLTGPKGNRLRSVAYLPQSVEGHAVLVAIACEEILMRSDATIGNATADESSLDDSVRKSYIDIGNKRGRFPEAAIVSMIDGSSALYKVSLLEGGEKFMLETELDKLRGTGQVRGEDLLGSQGIANQFSGAKLNSLRWIAQTVDSSEELKQHLGNLAPLEAEEEWKGPWKACRINLHGNISHWSINQAIRGIEYAMTTREANIVFIDIDSPGGSLSESLRFAEWLNTFDGKTLRTVAYVSGEARGDAALIALSCGATYVAPESTLGGNGQDTIQVDRIEELRGNFEGLALATKRDEGLLYGPICPDLPTFHYASERGEKKWIAESHSDKLPGDEQWVKGDLLEVGSGFNAKQLTTLQMVRGVEDSIESVAKIYDIESLPEVTQSNRVEMFVQRLGQQGWLPPVLLMIAFLTLMSELSTPGIGVAGFISALCFVLFFWTRFLNGTVEWLEILLFLVGFIFVGLEFFVLPGTGVFGFGGIVMILTSVVLASQTFLFPHNRYQLVQMAWNTSSLLGTFLGIGIGLFLIRNQIENLPFFRWFKLQPVSIDEAQELDQREAMVHWEHLEGKAGITLTRCNPAGKAQFGDTLVNVISLNELIAEGQPVRVIEVRGNTVVVESIS